jgi:hypothetical protein
MTVLPRESEKAQRIGAAGRVQKKDVEAWLRDRPKPAVGDDTLNAVVPEAFAEDESEQ